MGVSHHGHCAVTHRFCGEGGRGQHRTFNMDMGIDQPRQDKGASDPGVRQDVDDTPLINDQSSWKLPAGHRVNKNAGYLFHLFS